MRKLVNDSAVMGTRGNNQAQVRHNPIHLAAAACVAAFSAFAPIISGCSESGAAPRDGQAAQSMPAPALHSSAPESSSAGVADAAAPGHRPCGSPGHARAMAPQRPHYTESEQRLIDFISGKAGLSGVSPSREWTDGDVIRIAKRFSWNGIGTTELIVRIAAAPQGEQRALTLALTQADGRISMRDYYGSGKSLPIQVIFTLAELTYHENPAVRLGAASLLGHTRAEIAVPALADRLADSDAEIRRQAVMSLFFLSQTGSDTAIAELIGARRNESPATRQEVALWLRMLDDRRATPAFIEMLEDADTDVRKLAVEGLGFIHDRSAQPALIRRLDDPDRLIRSSALGVLSEPDYRGPAVREAIRIHLRNPGAAEKCEALVDLWVYHESGMTPLVAGLRNGPNASVRRCASAIMDDLRIRAELQTPRADLRLLASSHDLFDACNSCNDDAR